MAGERLLESGDRRVTENLDVRITEGVRAGASALTATSSLTAVGVVDKPGAATFAAAGSASFAAVSGIVSAISLSSTLSSFTAEGSNSKFGASTFANDFTRTTEADDVRITEDGNTRVSSASGSELTVVANGVVSKSGVAAFTSSGTISSAGSRIEYAGGTSVKNSGAWQTPATSVNDNGVWKTPSGVYYYDVNIWKRVG
jgi:hypothetical protein